mgnify:CR=1 FL=1
MIRHAIPKLMLVLGVVLFLPQASESVGDEAEAASRFSKKPDVSKIYGKIQFVNSFPDFKVQIVNSFPDLKVKVVNSFPDKVGKWKIVNSFPDFKIQIVNSFPDFKVKYVNSFPGLP